MANIDKVTLPNGTSYNLQDSVSGYVKAPITTDDLPMEDPATYPPSKDKLYSAAGVLDAISEEMYTLRQRVMPLLYKGTKNTGSFNDITEYGTYWTKNENMTEAPIAGRYYGILNVSYASNGGSILQTWQRYDTGDVYTRSYVNNAWRSWTRLVKISEISTMAAKSANLPTSNSGVGQRISQVSADGQTFSWSGLRTDVVSWGTSISIKGFRSSTACGLLVVNHGAARKLYLLLKDGSPASWRIETIYDNYTTEKVTLTNSVNTTANTVTCTITAPSQATMWYIYTDTGPNF